MNILIAVTLYLAAALHGQTSALPRFSCDSAGILPGASYADLRRQFGDTNVRVAPVNLGEGETTLGLVLFPDDARRRVDITWYDSANQRFPSMVRIRGDSSDWTTATGVTLGTTLSALERLNGRPFSMAGFGFDGGGTVLTWDGGRLASGPHAACTFRASLEPPAEVDQRTLDAVIGDRAFTSTTPAMRAVHPRVNRLWLEYPVPHSPSPRREDAYHGTGGA